MRRYSETTIEISAPDLSVDVVENVYVNVNQLGVNFRKKAEVVDKVVKIILSAEETSRLAAGPVFMQIEAISKDGIPTQSGVIRYKLSDSIKKAGGETDAKSIDGLDIDSTE